MLHFIDPNLLQSVIHDPLHGKFDCDSIHYSWWVCCARPLLLSSQLVNAHTGRITLYLAIWYGICGIIASVIGQNGTSTIWSERVGANGCYGTGVVYIVKKYKKQSLVQILLGSVILLTVVLMVILQSIILSQDIEDGRSIGFKSACSGGEWISHPALLALSSTNPSYFYFGHPRLFLKVSLPTGITDCCRIWFNFLCSSSLILGLTLSGTNLRSSCVLARSNTIQSRRISGESAQHKRLRSSVVLLVSVNINSSKGNLVLNGENHCWELMDGMRT